MSKLADFLRRLGRDSEFEGKYEDDPEGFMKASGLSDEEREAVRSGNLDRIRELSGLSDVHKTQSTVKSYD